jgi:hypothetical protein
VERGLNCKRSFGGSKMKSNVNLGICHSSCCAHSLPFFVHRRQKRMVRQKVNINFLDFDFGTCRNKATLSGKSAWLPACSHCRTTESICIKFCIASFANIFHSWLKSDITDRQDMKTYACFCTHLERKLLHIDRKRNIFPT